VIPYRGAGRNAGGGAGDWAVLVAARDAGDAVDGDVVVAAPIGADKRRRKPGRKTLRAGVPKGRVAAVLGRPGDAEADFQAVVWKHRLPSAFSDSVLAQVKSIPEALDRKEIARRVDLRGHAFVTIDPASARDFDDALCTEPLDDGGVRLWVAIADVSHYVTESSALDVEAMRRGNSVYFPDRAIPMLPERLSGDLCSLRPGRDRFASVVELLFDSAGKPTRRSFYPAVIRSRARLVYEEAAEWMGEGGARKGDAPRANREVEVQLRTLWRLAEPLGRRRRTAGSIDFELPEPRIEVNSEGVVVDVALSKRTRAHQAVEEAMLAANQAVAEALVAAGCSAIYRVHEPPEARALAELRALFESTGLLPSRGSGELRARDIAAALLRVRGKPEERLVNQIALRSMRQARYSAESLGHFALGFPHYLHFTSPIRRYADLVVHRAVASALHGDQRGDAAALLPAEVRRIAGRISWRERVAMAAERERAKLACCAVMAPLVGQEFEGTITGVARHGLYVTLDAPYVEGLVHISRFREEPEFDERAQVLRGRRSGERFRLGDRLRVLLESVDIPEARIDLVVVLDGERQGMLR